MTISGPMKLPTLVALILLGSLACTPDAPVGPEKVSEAIGASSAGACPAWTKAEPCTFAGKVYAVGHTKSMKNTSLAISTAANRAKAALIRALSGQEAGEMELIGVEVPQAAHCDERVHILVRTGLSGEGLATCTADMNTTAEPLGGCPNWTNTVVAIQEGRSVAVGSVSGMKNQKLARRSAENRARRNLTQLSSQTVSYSFKNGANTVSSRSSGRGDFAEAQVHDMATCGDTIWVKVVR